MFFQEMALKMHFTMIHLYCIFHFIGSRREPSIRTTLKGILHSVARAKVPDCRFSFSFSFITFVQANRSSNVNIPWTEGGKLDGDYIYAFQKLVMPIALEYNPDFVIGKHSGISTGIF